MSLLTRPTACSARSNVLVQSRGMHGEYKVCIFHNDFRFPRGGSGNAIWHIPFGCHVSKTVELMWRWARFFFAINRDSEPAIGCWDAGALAKRSNTVRVWSQSEAVKLENFDPISTTCPFRFVLLSPQESPNASCSCLTVFTSR